MTQSAHELKRPNQLQSFYKISQEIQIHNVLTELSNKSCGTGQDSSEKEIMDVLCPLIILCTEVNYMLLGHL